MLNTQLTDLSVNTQATAFAALLNGGTIKVYDGTQPTVGADVTTQVLGATLTFNATAFSAPVAGVLTANAITSGTAEATITPTWARLHKSDGAIVADVSVGLTDANIAMGPFAIGDTVSVSSFTYTILKAYAGT